jgi:hypothetical protein
MDSVSIVFIEVKKVQYLGNARLDAVAQVLAESIGMLMHFLLQLLIILMIIACDFLNSKLRYWVPILAILCDGANFEFLVFDSGIKSVYSSGRQLGVIDEKSQNDLFAPSLKKSKVAKFISYLFSVLTDFCLLAFSRGVHFRLLSHGLHEWTMFIWS